MTHTLYTVRGTEIRFNVTGETVTISHGNVSETVSIETARVEYRLHLAGGATKTPPAPPAPAAGSWAASAMAMAMGDRSGFDWDAWKDEMKDRSFA